jgi:hypothetical protein
MCRYEVRHERAGADDQQAPGVATRAPKSPRFDVA